MKYLKLFGLVLGTIPALLISQDVIVLKNADEIKSKVVEITDLTIKYKKWENVNGPIYNLNKNEVLFIRYENGTKEVFTNPVEPVAEPENRVTPIPKKPSAAQSIQNQPEASNIQELDFETQGINDAKKFYKDKNAAVWTGVATFLTSPIVGLIPAIICSSTVPSDNNLNIPDNELIKNEVYYNSYKKQAHKIKKRQVWNSGWGIGTIVWSVLVLSISL